MKPLILLDLNGTVHAYSRGWQEGLLYDPPTEGFPEWAQAALKEFRLAILPARYNTPRDLHRVQNWLRKHRLSHPDIEVVAKTPIGVKLKIDDRALYFTGNWDDFPMQRLREFHTWSGR